MANRRTRKRAGAVNAEQEMIKQMTDTEKAKYMTFNQDQKTIYMSFSPEQRAKMINLTPDQLKNFYIRQPLNLSLAPRPQFQGGKRRKTRRMKRRV